MRAPTTKSAPVAFVTHTLDELTLEDEPSFRHVGLYADLKQILEAARYPFRVLGGAYEGRWDRALLLNLTFWGAPADDPGHAEHACRAALAIADIFAADTRRVDHY